MSRRSIPCPNVDYEALRELHDAVVEYLAGFDYPTGGGAWQRLQRASADAAVVLGLDGRFGDAEVSPNDGSTAT